MQASLIERVEALRRAEPAQALAELDVGFADALRRASAAERGALWRTRAHVLRALARSREAVACYRRAARAFVRAGDTREAGRCDIGLVDALMVLGRYAEARRAAARGRRRLSRARDRAALARLLNNEGNLWHRLDLPERALDCYRAAIAALRRAGDERSARMIGTNVGNCLSLLGRCDEARAHYREARGAQAAAGAVSEALTAAYNLAYLDFLEHRHEAALTGLARVREEAQQRGLAALAALALLDRAEIFLRLGAHGEALDEAEGACAAFAPLGMRYEHGKAELFGALARYRLGAPAAARRGIERAIERFAAEGNLVWAGEALLGLATVWWHDGNLPAASALLAAARRRFASAGDREREACALTLGARASLGSGDARTARRLLAAANARRATSARLEHLRLAAGAALARHDGDVPRARRLLARAAGTAERLAARILDEQWRATFWGEWGWPHRERAALELAAGDVAAAFEALEAGRGRVLVGRAARRSARGAALPASVRRWAAATQARERARRAGETVAGASAPLVDRALRRALAVQPPRRIRAGALQRVLPEDALFVDYFTHDGLLGALTLSRGALRGRASLVAAGRIEPLLQAVLFSLRGAAFAPAAERGADPLLATQLAELAALVLWPALDGRTPRGLAVAPTGALARVPWAALPLPDGRAVCECCEVVVVPGLRLGLSRRSARAVAGSPLIVAAAAGELQAVASETDAVLASAPHAMLLAGPEATAERFLELAPRADWIHFAGHGGWRADAPHESGLRLHDRWLLAGELAEHPLLARWVTLSACHTARALVRPGEEWFGLARSFLLAGAGAVVAAQWDVEDAPTGALMADLYPRLAAGVGLARALADVQAARHLAAANPLDWAGFAALAGPGALGGSRSGGGVAATRRTRPRATSSPVSTAFSNVVPGDRTAAPERIAGAGFRIRRLESSAPGGSRS
ncbi:MAG TPA: CHAT domain-containing protein [Candidatus Acidoferrales bacterium]|nr:CHAT domain-containing protein [Candidatus Acidoferrales bacterium]